MARRSEQAEARTSITGLSRIAHRVVADSCRCELAAASLATCLLSGTVADVYRYTFATILSLYNKWMFSPEYYGFSYPLFVTGCHMWVQFAMAGFVRVAFKEKFKPPERPSRKDYV